MKQSVSTKWHDLGIELLDDENLQALDEIEKNYPRACTRAVQKCFSYGWKTA